MIGLVGSVKAVTGAVGRQCEAVGASRLGIVFQVDYFFGGAQSPPRWGERNRGVRVVHQTAHRGTCG
ncbi:hypothetical protein Afil01_54600 [Actinorhabdospora filicis]|uniref:Uncharacterized protein n=1 Tax=Actinorhabdospora filicis TaxID=1785913 RepID=A0A9W6SRB2_9ACTN|nr:hypothetical protein Afil01_54600 [Actinorhabdospora filicis]